MDVHYPYLLEPYAYLDETGRVIQWGTKNDKGVLVHNFGPHEGRRIWNHHYFGRSMEALVWKGVRQNLDDTGAGNVRSSRSMVGTITSMNGQDYSAASRVGLVRNTTAWDSGREFLLTVLFGPKPALPPTGTGSGSGMSLIGSSFTG